MSFVRGKEQHGGIGGNFLEITTTCVKQPGPLEYPEVYLCSRETFSY